jgi:ribosome recycling factor
MVIKWWYMILEHELIKLLREKFAKVIEIVEEDFSTVRIGRAKADMIENVGVQAYGGYMRLQEVATITAPDPNLLVVSPFDKSLMRAVEKAISDSELQLSPAVSGDIIRIVVPSLTQERRLDFAKLLKQKIESGKIMLRQARQDVKDKIDVLKEKKEVSEDDIYMLLEGLDKITGEFVERIDEMGRAKEKEIMAV